MSSNKGIAHILHTNVLGKKDFLNDQILKKIFFPGCKFFTILKKMFNPRVNTTLNNNKFPNILVTLTFESSFYF